MDDSAVTFTRTGAVIHTGDGVRLYQARVVRQGLKACQKGMRINRAYTPTNCLRSATNITGQTYPSRGKKALESAITDLDEWIRACEAAMPVVRESADG